ncbi:MAG TPA: transglutaminase family protein [Burkholderiaceae bacterium]|jgi:transglutaminase-like putative cysteine protease
MNPQRYTVQHETRYAYTAPVSQSWQLARLTPRALPWQRVVAHSVQIDPPADERRDELDSFGNMVTHFGLHSAHRMLRVRMECQVEVSERADVETAAAAVQSQSLGTMTQSQSLSAPLPPAAPLGWEGVRDAIRRDPQQDDLIPVSMCEPTPLLPLSDAARHYASKSFGRGRPWLEAVTELMQRIHRDFDFKPGATTVSTSVDEVLYQRSGVCQDFAHLMLACLRGFGLPARYVSGYLLTDPPPGMPRLMGADASHAWVAAYSPQHGWVEFDPTNSQLADTRYITLTWGADFADVVPLRGVILGGGEQRMLVQVSVIPA